VASGALVPLSPFRLLRRERIESAIALAAPMLDLVLAAGERVSRVLGPEDDYYPTRPPGEAFELRPAIRSGEPPGVADGAAEPSA
jgi:hypothetical protein